MNVEIAQNSLRLPDGSRQLPVAAMLANFPRPNPASDPPTPSLLSHTDVRTLFHEFGHVMHVLCSRPEYKLLSAFEVERDFLEMPSQVAVWVVT